MTRFKVRGAWQICARHQLGKGEAKIRNHKKFVGAKGVNQDGGGLQPPFVPLPPPPPPPPLDPPLMQDRINAAILQIYKLLK